MQVRGAGERARSLKVKGEEIWEMIKMAGYKDSEACSTGVLDMVYYLCRHRSTRNAPWSALSFCGMSLMTTLTKLYEM